jgi:hypothetical protein
LSFDMKSDSGDKVIDDFLNAQTKLGTFKTYKTQMKVFLEFKKMTGEEILNEKRNDKDFRVETSILEFRKWILQRGKSENYATSTIGAVRGFYSFYRMPLIFRKHESRKLTEKNRVTSDFLFDREDLAKMALCGNLKERYILIVGKSVGLRASDFLKFTYGQFRSLKLETDAPIAIGEIGTLKESVKAYPFLDSDVIPIVKQMLESNKDKKDSDKILIDTEDNLSVILQNLAKKAGFEVENGAVHGRRIRFHCLRKFLIDHLSAFASESQWKQIVGKTISEAAYVSTDQLRNVYSRAMPSILINGNGAKTRKLIELEQALIESQRRQTALETTNETLRNRMEKLETTLAGLGVDVNSIKKSVANVEQKQQEQNKRIVVLEETERKKPEKVRID